MEHAFRFGLARHRAATTIAPLLVTDQLGDHGFHQTHGDRLAGRGTVDGDTDNLGGMIGIQLEDRRHFVSTLHYGPSPVALNFTGNHFLAHLQAATLRRFEQGRGYFITLAGTNDQGQDTTVSHWIHPSVRLSFSYETEDEYGNPPKTIELEDDPVDALLEAMDRPFGVLWGFSAEHGHYLPFMPPDLPQPPSESDEIPGQ